jgi:AraC family transcriptional activator of pobA
MNKDQKPLKIIDSVSELHRLLYLPPPKNPLITLIDHADEKQVLTDDIHRISLNFYNISIKRSFRGQLRYGKITTTLIMGQ